MIVLNGIAKNVGWTTPVFPMIATASGQPLTGAAASADSEISKDGASFTDCTNEITESGSTGHYSLELTQSEMNADQITIRITATGCYTQTLVILTTGALGDLPANVTQWKGAAAPNNTGDAYAAAFAVQNYAKVLDNTVGDPNQGYGAPTETQADFVEANDRVQIGDILLWPLAETSPMVTFVTALSVDGYTHGLAWTPALDEEPPFDQGMTILRNPIASFLQNFPIPASPAADSVNDRVSRIPDSPAAVGSAMTLEDDAITAAKFLDTGDNKAFPLKSADSGVTTVARTGADAETLETLADATAELLGDIDDKTTNLPAQPAAVNSAMQVADKTGFFLETAPPTKEEISDEVWTAETRTLTS